MGNANNYIGSQINYKSTIDDISIGETTKGIEVGGTIDDISIGKIIEEAEAKN
jgi:hypothetical protein